MDVGERKKAETNIVYHSVTAHRLILQKGY